jgi:large subunit ribosomal protein L10
MATSKLKKQGVFELLTSIRGHKAVVFLTTKDSSETINAEKNFAFRKATRDNGVIVKVIKNTLLAKAFEGLEKPVGQTYMAFLDDKTEGDEVKVPKEIVTLIQKEFEANFKLLGSLVNGEFYDASKTLALAKTLSKVDSLAQTAGLINQLISRIAIGVKEVSSSLARSVNEVKTQKS